MSENNVVVVGSCMMDFVSYASRLPKEGETIHGTKFVTTFGGKGANQCIAAAKLGAKTTLVARVGEDSWGENYIQNLNSLGVNSNYVFKTNDYSSGIAQINVADSGQNQIVIVAGANSQLNTQDVEKAQEVISQAAVVVCQLETSTDVAIRALQLCRGISILNGAPAIANCDVRLLTLPNIFCVNETEAAVFTGLPVNSATDAEAALHDLLEKGCHTVIITLGDVGALFASKESRTPVHIRSPKVQCTDTTGAGDAFIGALAYLIATQKNLTLKDSITIACYVAADSVTRPGTQISYPGPEILQRFDKLL